MAAHTLLETARDALVWGRVRCTTEDGRRFVCCPGYPRGNLESQCGAARWHEAVVETPVTGFRNGTDASLDTIEQHFKMALEFLAAMATGLFARRAEMRKETEPARVDEDSRPTRRRRHESRVEQYDPRRE